MIPMKYASSEINSAASAKNETTKLSALATGLRLMMTAAPKTSIIRAKTQKRKGDILVCHSERSEGPLTSWLITLSSLCVPHSDWEVPRFARDDISFFLVPFQHNSVHHAADLEQFVFVMHH